MCRDAKIILCICVCASRYEGGHHVLHVVVMSVMQRGPPMCVNPVTPITTLQKRERSLWHTEKACYQHRSARGAARFCGLFVTPTNVHEPPLEQKRHGRKRFGA